MLRNYKMKPNRVDAHVGQRLRIRRIMLGMSQEKLGDEVGITFQQIQKYEWGLNRIGVSRLYEFSCILNVPVSYFFEGLEHNEECHLQEDLMPNREDKETLSMVREFRKISVGQRKRVVALVKSMAPSSAAEPTDI